MPSSRDPKNYPPTFQVFVQTFPNAPDEITIPFLSKAAAIRARVQFYGFIRACETEAEKRRKAGDISTAAEYASFASLARTRQLEIAINPDAPIDSDGHILIFKSRDTTDVAQAFAKAMEDYHLAPAPRELTGITATTDATADVPIDPRGGMIPAFDRGMFDPEKGPTVDDLFLPADEEET